MIFLVKMSSFPLTAYAADVQFRLTRDDIDECSQTSLSDP